MTDGTPSRPTLREGRGNGNHQHLQRSNDAGHSETFYYVTELNDVDVLFGRGTGPNNRKGNQLFRQVVDSQVEMFFQTQTGDEKLMVIERVISDVYERGGKFVRKRRCRASDIGIPSTRRNQTVIVYEVITDWNQLIGKTSQALRYSKRVSEEAATSRSNRSKRKKANSPTEHSVSSNGAVSSTAVRSASSSSSAPGGARAAPSAACASPALLTAAHTTAPSPSRNPSTTTHDPSLIISLPSDTRLLVPLNREDVAVAALAQSNLIAHEQQVANLVGYQQQQAALDSATRAIIVDQLAREPMIVDGILQRRAQQGRSLFHMVPHRLPITGVESPTAATTSLSQHLGARIIDSTPWQGNHLRQSQVLTSNGIFNRGMLERNLALGNASAALPTSIAEQHRLS